jgi:hypothetical protein
MSAKRIVIIGGPGDGVVVAQTVRDLAKAGREVSLFGFLNDRLERGEHVFGAPVLGTLQTWQQLPQDVCFVPALHKVCEMVSRRNSFWQTDHRWASGPPYRRGTISQSVSFSSPACHHPACGLWEIVSIRAGKLGHDALARTAYRPTQPCQPGRRRRALAPKRGDGRGWVAVFGGFGFAVMKNVESFSVGKPPEANAGWKDASKLNVTARTA